MKFLTQHFSIPAHTNDVLDIGSIIAGGKQIDRNRDARFAGADDGEVDFKLAAVALGPGDPGGIFHVTGKPAQLCCHKGRMGVIDAKDDGLFIAQAILSGYGPQILGDGPRAVRHSDIALEVRCRVALALGVRIAVLIHIGDTLLEEVRHKISILDGLFGAVGADRLTKIVVSVAPLLFISQRPVGFLQLPGSGRKTQLKCSIEVLQHSEPIAKAGAVTLVDHHKIEEIPVVVLIDLLAIQFLIEILVVGKKHLADQMLALRKGLLVNRNSFIRERGKGLIGLDPLDCCGR